MRDKERINITTESLNRLWCKEQYQDLRFWQLICVLEKQAKAMYNVNDVWHLEEEQWQRVIMSL